MTPPPLTVGTKILYGFGSVAYGVKDAAFRTFLLLYYNQVLGLDAALVSAAIMLALVLDAIIDPLIGQVSDNLRTRWGRRHPLMYAAALPLGASFLLLWSPPAGLSDMALVAYLAGTAVLVRGLTSLYEIPSSSLAPELTRDYDDRTSVAAFRHFFGYAGALGIAFAMLYVFLRPTEAYPVGQLNPAGYWTFGLVGAAMMTVSILVSAAGTHGRIPYLRQPSGEKRGAAQQFREMRESFRNKGFRAIIAFGVLKFTAIGMSAALALYFGTFFWGFSSPQLAILTLDGIVAAGIAIWFAPFASRKIGKRNAAVLLAVVAVTAAVTPFLLRLAGLFPANGDPWLLPAVFAFQSVTSLCGITSAVLVHAMIGDVVEESELATGRRSEGLFYSANMFMQQCVSGLGILAAGLLLSGVGFPEGAKPGQVDPGVVTALVAAFVPLYALLYGGGACFLLSYRIDRASHEANVARLRERGGGEPVGAQPKDRPVAAESSASA